MPIKLSLADILTSPVTTVAPDCMVEEALALMRRESISALVVTEGKRPVGIFTERDAVMVAYRNRDAHAITVRDVMGTPPFSAPPEMDYREGYRLINEQRIRHLLVADGQGLLLGIVTEGDFMEHLGSEFMVHLKKVGDVMVRNVLTLPGDAIVDEAIRLMAREHISCVLVEHENRPVGIFTERDLVQQKPEPDNAQEIQLSQIMSRPVSTVAEDENLPAAISKMDEAHIRRLVVTDTEGLIVGLVTRHDIVKQLYDRDMTDLQELLRQREQELEDKRSEIELLNELRRTEERLAEAQRVAKQGSYERDFATRDLWCSDEITRIVETDLQKHGEKWETVYTSLIHPDDLEYANKALSDSLAKKEPSYQSEHRICFPDGRIKYVRERGEHEYDEGGNPVRTVGTLQDISDTHRIDHLKQSIIRGTSSVIGDAFFQELVENLARALGVRYAFIGRAGDTLQTVTTLAVWAGNGFGDNFEYTLAKTPCDNVVGKELCIYPRDIREQFPEDRLLVEMEAESYAGVPLFGSAGVPLGLLAILDDKPLEDEELVSSIIALFAGRAGAEIERMGVDLRLEKALQQTVQAVAHTVEQRDPYTAGHQQRVAELAVAISKEMGLESKRTEGIQLGSMLHDIGNTYVPTDILHRPGKLSDVEFSIIKNHATVGYEILKDVDFPWPVAQMILQHHERLDGSGYPNGLKGDEIILEARILAVADVVEAINAHRPYRPSMGIEVALEEISSKRGTAFDTRAVDACILLFKEKSFSW
ncbi:MAG: CBS domain-containing protein [Candidatus Sedimenticola sp. 20ELBAFRAG]